MTGIELAALLCFFYWWEGAIWLPRDAFALRRTWDTWRRLHPPVLLGNPDAGFVQSLPIPPLRPALVLHTWEVAASADGVFAARVVELDPNAAPRNPGPTFGWDPDSPLLADEKLVRSGGRVLVATAVSARARHLARLLRRWRNTEAAERNAVLEQSLAESVDIGRIEERAALLQQMSKPLAVAVNLAFFVLFGMLPALWFLLPPALSLWVIGAVWIATWALVQCGYWLGHRRLFPQARSERWARLFTTLVLPFSVPRSLDALARDAFVEFDGPLVSLVLLPRAQARAVAAKALRTLDHPRPFECDPGSPWAGPLAEFRRRYRAVFWDRAQPLLDLEPGFPGEPSDLTDGCTAYCPRCTESFTVEGALCADCQIRAVAASHE